MFRSFGLLHAASVVLTAFIANERGRRWWVWALVAAFLPVLALILVLVLPPPVQAGRPGPAPLHCPTCGRMPPGNARFCPHCGSSVHPDGKIVDISKDGNP